VTLVGVDEATLDNGCSARSFAKSNLGDDVVFAVDSTAVVAQDFIVGSIYLGFLAAVVCTFRGFGGSHHGRLASLRCFGLIVVGIAQTFDPRSPCDLSCRHIVRVGM